MNVIELIQKPSLKSMDEKNAFLCAWDLFAFIFCLKCEYSLVEKVGILTEFC